MDILQDKKIIVIILVIIFLIYIGINTESFYNFTNVPNETYKIDDINIVPEKGIPKIIHRIVLKDKKKWNSTWYEGYESWLKCFPQPEYTHMIWFDEDFEPFVQEHFPFYLEAFKNYNYHIKRVDMLRPLILYKYGGIYADMDYVVYKNFYDQLPPDKVSTPESPYKYHEHIQNALLISPPKHNFWLILLDEAINRKDVEVVFNATGPALYSDLYHKYPDMFNLLDMNLYNPDKTKPELFNAPNVIAKHLLSNVWISVNKF
jgi:mannosyltransferase OCH1-like enzyme